MRLAVLRDQLKGRRDVELTLPIWLFRIEAGARLTSAVAALTAASVFKEAAASTGALSCRRWAGSAM
ncbi:MAG: hypothetical protein R3D67_17030 [Hyphomicrobiaceae bacterium]